MSIKQQRKKKIRIISFLFPISFFKGRLLFSKKIYVLSVREKKEPIVKDFSISKNIHNRKDMRRSSKFFESIRNEARERSPDEIVESERKARRKALLVRNSSSLSLFLPFFL